MNPLDIVKAITGAGPRLKKGDQWQASHKIDGKQTDERPKVTRFDSGLSAEEGIWFHFEFTETDGPHTLRGSYALNNKGETIKLDNEDVEEDNVILSNKWKMFELKGVIEFQFVKNGKTHRYRFDATVLKPV